MSSGQSGRKAARLDLTNSGLGRDAQTHDPSPLGNAAVAHESKLFEQAFWAGMQVRATLRVTPGHLLRVGLDQASTCLLYSGQRRRNSGACHAFTAVPGASEQAPDPPVRQLRQLLLIGLGILDGGHSLAGGPYWHQPTHWPPR